MGREGVAQGVTDHTECQRSRWWRVRWPDARCGLAVSWRGQFLQVGRHSRIGFTSVKVVGVDYSKWLGDDIARGAHGVGRAPGFAAPLRHRVACRQIMQVLEGVFDRDPVLVALADLGSEFSLKVFTDDENDFAETSPHGIKDGVVDHGLTGRPHGIELFEAPVAGAHTGGE